MPYDVYADGKKFARNHSTKKAAQEAARNFTRGNRQTGGKTKFTVRKARRK